MAESARYWRKPRPPHSRVKSEIVTAYFVAWAGVLNQSSEKLVYLDLYAGRGQYWTGEISTPLMVLRRAAELPFLRDKLLAIFNDVKPLNCSHLRKLIDDENFNVKFRNAPIVLQREVDEPLARVLGTKKKPPTFCFIDPYGYKGVSMQLIESVVKDFACECLVFFHTSGINRNMDRPDCRPDFVRLFGEARYKRLLGQSAARARDREHCILDAFAETAREAGARYVLPMQFNFKRTRRISHHLVFLTKHPLGFSIMKYVMAKHSSKTDEGIPWYGGRVSYVYIEGYEGCAKQLSFGIDGPMAELKDLLRKEFGGRWLRVRDVIDSCDKKQYLYTSQNIKSALSELEKDGRLHVRVPPARRRRKGTFADELWIRIS
ncbi:MAG TPA: three-Cys-motif partner protein TcmP [Acidobacteriota bacterium]|nr:three-Cys-motif partner protein TcmP [Acidobacteriota bacterium]